MLYRKEIEYDQIWRINDWHKRTGLVFGLTGIKIVSVIVVEQYLGCQ
ncbi:hypothetical protein QNI16_09565 [Cytophagaceae bacterium YF14B1]|uniref:Uncharacterized protein n=1 Tax=Xanthocytophaga flava TaxID=3048013 RepID=A0AAE3QPY3_9BACT|nr:hypothetical protein [Xanthocytophaga flavus]MDJ1480729.1 hypothetical protein [Xanthocytophaga flavus]